MYSKRFIRRVVVMGIVLMVVVGAPMTLVVFASAPWDTVPTDAEAVGVWQVGNTSQRMTFYPSHRMTFSNLPVGILEQGGENKDGSTRRISGVGGWESFSNAGGYGTVTNYSVSGSKDSGYAMQSEWFGSARQFVIFDPATSHDFELDFHRVSSKP